MSEQRHIYARISKSIGLDISGSWWRKNYAPADAKRHTLTEGPEWDALMERAADTLADLYVTDHWAKDLLHDLLAYLGEQP